MSVGRTDFYRAGFGLGFGLALASASAQVMPLPAERVQRQAEGPLRWIVEAGKLKSRGRLVAAVASPMSLRAGPVVRRAAPQRPATAPVANVATAAADLPAPAEPAAPEQHQPLELLAGDAPALPEPMLAELQSDAVLELALIVLADGSVGAVTTLASTHPGVDEHAMAAVREWRFKPGPQAQVRQVELVFHPRR